MNSSCMYGAAHEGGAVIVRGKTGQSVGTLCPAHYKQHHKTLESNGFHFHTPEEMAARGEGQFNADGREAPIERLDQDTRLQWESSEADDSGSGETEIGDASVYPYPDRALSRIHSAPTSGPGEVSGLAREGQESGRAPAILEKVANVRGNAESGLPARGSGGGNGIAPHAPMWWQGVGEFQLEDWQRELLWRPFDPSLIEKRYDGLYYLPWVYVWRRLLEAFAPHVPQMLPLSEPKLVDDTVTIHYAMLVHGQYVGEAWGEMAKKGGNKKVTYAMCAEGCCSDAITRIAKRLGVNLELWEPQTIRDLEGRNNGRTENRSR